MREVLRSILLFALAALLMSPPPGLAGGSGRATPPPADGDWVVNDTTSVSDTSILLNGSLIVQPAGTLTLTNVTLVLNCSYPGQFRIDVRDGGALHLVRCTLSSVNDSRGYHFSTGPGSVLEISGSEVRNAGTAPSDSGSTSGVLVRNGSAVIQNSTFIHNFEALHVRDCSPAISNCTFVGNEVGIAASNSSLRISSCNITESKGSGVSLYNGSDATVSGCSFSLNFRYGLYVNRSVVDATDDVFLKNYIGFHAEYSNGSRIRSCTFQGEDYIGVRFWQCPDGRLSDCRVSDSTRIALCSVGSHVQAVNTTLGSFMYYAYLDRGSVMELVNCSLDRQNLFFGDDSSRLNVSWFLNVHVLWWSSGLPVAGASVSVADQTGNVSFRGITNAEGRLDWGVVPGYAATRTTYRPFGPYTATASSRGLVAHAATEVNRSLELLMLLDDIGPAIQIDRPADGAFLNSSSVTLRGTAWDNETDVSRIDVNLDNGSWAPANGTSSWDFAAGLGDGPHAAMIRGRDTANNTNIAVVTFTVDTAAPALCITSPEDRNVTRERQVNVAGATEAGNASVTVNGTPVPVDNSTGEFNATVNLTEGDNLIPVTATDRAGNVAEMDLHVRSDTMVAPFDINPRDGAWFNQSVITINGTVEENSLLVIRALDAQGNYTGDIRLNLTAGNFSVNYTLHNGTNLLRIEAFDPYGNAASEDITLTVDRVPPLLNVTSPPKTEYYTRERRLVIAGIVESGAALYLNGRVVLVEDTNFSKPVTLDLGLNRFTLAAVDRAGNVRTVTLNAYLDRTPPSLTVRSPRDRARVTGDSILVKGITEQCATVLINGDPAKVDASGVFKKQVPLRMGNNSLDITAYDRAGNPASFHIVVDRVAAPPLLSDWGIAALTILIAACAFAGVVVWDTRRTTGKWGLKRPLWLKVPDRIKNYIPRPTFGREEFESGPGAVQVEPRKEGGEPEKPGTPAAAAPAQPGPTPALPGARLGDEFIVSQKPLSAQPATMPAATEVPAQLPLAEPAGGALAAPAPAAAPAGAPEPAAPPPATATATMAGPPAPPAAPPAKPAGPPEPPAPEKPKEPLDPLAEIMGTPTKKL